jgi:cytochrome c5
MVFSGLLLIACDKKPQSQTASPTVEHAAEEHAEFPKPTDPSLMAGYEIFAKVCSHCHLDSEYAPVINHPQAWAKRLDKKGRDTLLKHAIEGYGDMMPKGGRRGKDLTDEQVGQGLDYILSLLPKEK